MYRCITADSLVERGRGKERLHSPEEATGLTVCVCCKERALRDREVQFLAYFVHFRFVGCRSCLVFFFFLLPPLLLLSGDLAEL